MSVKTNWEENRNECWVTVNIYDKYIPNEHDSIIHYTRIFCRKTFRHVIAVNFSFLMQIRMKHTCFNWFIR